MLGLRKSTSTTLCLIRISPAGILKITQTFHVFTSIIILGFEKPCPFSSTQFVIVFFAALLLTLRAGFLNLTIEEEGADDDKRSLSKKGTDEDSFGEHRSPKVFPSKSGDEFEMALTPFGQNARRLSYEEEVEEK